MILNFLALILIKKSIENQTRKTQMLSSKVINKYLTIMKTRPACQNVVYFYALTWLVPKYYILSIVETQMRLGLLVFRQIGQSNDKIFYNFAEVSYNFLYSSKGQSLKFW